MIILNVLVLMLNSIDIFSPEHNKACTLIELPDPSLFERCVLMHVALNHLCFALAICVHGQAVLVHLDCRM